jgi:hypothetical protein
MMPSSYNSTLIFISEWIKVPPMNIGGRILVGFRKENLRRKLQECGGFETQPYAAISDHYISVI